MIDLGDRVEDSVTGYTGIATSREIWLQGCNRIGIQAKMEKEKNKLPIVSELYYVDEPQLVIVKKNAIAPPVKKKKALGGPSGFKTTRS